MIDKQEIVADARGRVAVRLGKEGKFINFTNNALCDLEEELGHSVMALFGGDETTRAEKLGFRQVRAMMWAGIRGAKGARYTLEEVGEMMDVSDLAYYTQAIAVALNAKFAKAKEGDPELEARLRPTSEAETPPSL